MTDDEIRDYIERNTLNGALSRLNRELRAVWAAIRATREARILYRFVCWILDSLTRFISHLAR